MILTTSEAAEELRVTPVAVRKMVERGELVPVLTGSSPLRFHLLDVMDAQERRLTECERATLDTLAARLLADGG